MDKEEKQAYAIGGMLALVAGVVAFFLAIVIDGYVTMTVWTWLAVPILGVDQIGFWQALGLGVVAGMFNGRPKYIAQSKDKKSSDVITEVIMLVFVTPLITLATAYVIHLFI